MSQEKIKLVIYWTILSPEHSVEPYYGAMLLNEWNNFNPENKYNWRYIAEVEVPAIDGELLASVQNDMADKIVIDLQKKLDALKGSVDD